MAVFVTSDLHLNDTNIIQECRPKFRTIKEHDDYIIEQFNSVVKKDDLVYILGDLGFTPKDQLYKLVRQLNGRKILIIGNHDKLNDNDYINMGFIQVFRHPVYYNDNIVMSHEPLQEAYNSKHVICLHGHIHRSRISLQNFYNVNIEFNGYKPINIDYYKEIAANTCLRTRWEPFGKEWFNKFYVYDK